MPLERQNVPIRFVQGLDLKDDFKQVMPGKWLTLENAIFQTPGKLRKRNGYQSLSAAIQGGGSFSSGKGLATFQSQLLQFDGNYAYSFSPIESNWANKGTFVGVEASLEEITRNSFNLSFQDRAQAANGLELYTWTYFLSDGIDHLHYSIRDSNTGEFIIYDQTVDGNPFSSAAAKVFALQDNFVILFEQQQTSTVGPFYLVIYTIPIASPTTAPIFLTPITDLNQNSPVYDGTIYNNRVYFAYDSSTSNHTVVNYITDTPALGAPFTSTSPSNNAISVFADSTLGQIWVVTAYDDNTSSTNINYFILNSGLTSYILSPLTITSGTRFQFCYSTTGHADNGSGQVWYCRALIDSVNPVFSPAMIQSNTLTNTGTIGAQYQFVSCALIAAKVFQYNGFSYIPIFYSSTLQSTIFLAQDPGTGGRCKVVARVLSGITGLIPTSPTELAESIEFSSGVFKFPTTQVVQSDTSSFPEDEQTGITNVVVDFNSLSSYNSQEVANNLYVTSGLLRMYDGAVEVEQGFNLFPEGFNISQSNTGGALGNASVATTYQYALTYEWVDNQGQTHRSSPSFPAEGGATASFASGVTTGSVMLRFPTLKLTEKNNVIINIYRTEGNGTIFYTLFQGSQNLIYNDPTVDTFTYTDTEADSTLIGHALLYTTGGVVPNDPGPAASALSLYQSRLLLVPSENKNQIWFSEQVVPGTPAQFSAELTINVDQRGGDIVAIAPLDANLIIFKREDIFYMSGSGPDATGGQNDFSPTQLVTADAGCVDVRSTVFMPQGIMFKSTKGIYLLDRALQVSYIGAPVESYNNQTVVSATLMSESNQVRFALAGGPVLVYDYYVQQWSVFTGVLSTSPPVQATLYSDNYTYVQSNGVVWEETPGTFLDGAAAISMKLLTGWLSMADLQGFERARRMLILGDYISPHTLTVKVAYDFNSTFAQTDTIVVSSNPAPYQWRIDFERQKCQAIQFQMQDTPSPTLGEGLSLSSFNLMVGVKKGSNKVVPGVIYS